MRPATGSRSGALVTGLLVLGSFAVVARSAPVAGQAGRGAASNIPDLPYRLVEWPTPPTSAAGVPGAWNFIQVASVAVTPGGTILVLHRGAHPMMEFDSRGTFVRSWGDGMFSEGKVAAIPEAHWTDDKSHYSAVYGPAGCASCGAHSVRVDPQGNIWVVDAPGHVVYKLSPEWKEMLRLGAKGVSGTGPNNFNLPTDVGFAPNGDVYVSDGYGSARVVKYSRDGKYLREWGRRGKGPGEFGLPHNLVVDAQGRVYVTDRDNQRIEVFDPDGKFLTQWTGTGGISGLAITKDQRIWTGGTLRDLDGKVVGKLPGPGTAGAHGVAVASSGEVYLAQLSGVVQKFVRAIQVGYCTSLANLAAAKAAGFDYVELGTTEIAALSDDDFEQAVRRVAEVGLPTPAANLFLPATLKVTGPDVNREQQMAYVRKAFDRLSRLGVQTVVFGSGGARRVPDGFPKRDAFDQLVDFGRRIAPEARSRGITVAVEPLRRAETNIINSAAEGLELVEAVRDPAFQLMIDFFHLASEGEDPAIVERAREHVRHLHMANPNGRVFPLAWDEYEYSSFFAKLRGVGYAGRISVEASSKDFAAEAPRAIALLRRAFER